MYTHPCVRGVVVAVGVGLRDLGGGADGGGGGGGGGSPQGHRFGGLSVVGPVLSGRVGGAVAGAEAPAPASRGTTTQLSRNKIRSRAIWGQTLCAMSSPKLDNSTHPERRASLRFMATTRAVRQLRQPPPPPAHVPTDGWCACPEDLDLDSLHGLRLPQVPAPAQARAQK